jgi:hypothetical protein
VEQEAIFILFFMIAIAEAITVRNLAIPYTVALVVTALEKLNLEQRIVQAEELKWAAHHLLLTEKNEIIDLFHHRIIGQSVYKKMLADIDRRLLHLESSK